MLWNVRLVEDAYREADLQVEAESVEDAIDAARRMVTERQWRQSGWELNQRECSAERDRR